MFGVEINLVAVLICAVAAMAIGYLWYSNMLFAKAWMKSAGITEADVKKGASNMPVTYGGMFVGALVMAYVLAYFINFANAVIVTDGIIVGFWAWLGFIATSFLGGVLFEKKPMQLYYINAGYNLVLLCVMGAILALMR